MRAIRLRMGKCLDYLSDLYKGINVGRADPALLSVVRVTIDATAYRLDQLAVISTCGTQLLKAEPYDASWLRPIEAAINDAALGITTERAPHAILVKIPQPDGSRRQELFRVAKDLAEQQRIAIRNIRREARTALPEEHRSIENLTKEHIAAVDELLAHKESQLLPKSLFK